MAFFDSQWQNIMANSPFSEEVVISLADGITEFCMKGIFYSGTYGERSEAKYVRAKAIARWTFQASAMNIPEIVTKKDLRNATLERENGDRFRIVTITGADSGVLNMELYVKSAD